jgi:prophage DNA circulation protein
MAELLSENLRPASFRGVPFQVDISGLETGRRIQVHEYPQRDKPLAQDMGRSTRQLSFDAFVAGADYVEQANALLNAMETAGSGQLIHPWFGTLRVNALGCQVSFDSGLGVARFQLQFVESGELSFPAASNSTAAVSRIASDNLEISSVNQFADVFEVLGWADYVTSQALTTIGSVLTFLSNPAFALSSALGYGSLLGNLTSLTGLIGTPITFAWNFAGLLNISGKAKSGELTGQAQTRQAKDKLLMPMVRGLTRMAADSTLTPPAVTTSASLTSRQATVNERAIKAQTRQLLLVQAVGLTSYLNCTVYDDIVALRAELGAALDAEMLLAANDDLYLSLSAARAAMWRDLTERSRDSARLVTLTPPEVLPVLTIAYDYYEDALRDEEIIARNFIRHPGFTPVKSLKLLSR